MAFRTSSLITLAVMVIGIILTTVGVALYEASIASDQGQDWWIWFLIITGLVLAIGGTVATIILLSMPEKAALPPGAIASVDTS